MEQRRDKHKSILNQKKFGRREGLLHTHGCVLESRVSLAMKTADAATKEGRYGKKLYSIRVSSARKFPRNSRLSEGICMITRR